VTEDEAVEKAVNKAIKGLGYRKFDDYLAARTGKTLVEMAGELQVNEQRFIVFHSRWIDEKARKGKVAPLRLKDED
jgi:hypothetical protein